MKEKAYQICNNCVMDTTDSKISFDENGVCSRCNEYSFCNKLGVGDIK